MQNIVEHRKKKWVDFYDLNSDVKKLLIVRHRENEPQCPPLSWEYMKEREEYAYLLYEKLMGDVEVIQDDTIPYLFITTGTEIFAEAFGCNVHRPANNNPFALPLIKDVSEMYKIKQPKLEDTHLVKLFDMADNLKARVGKEAVLRLPDIQTPMDVAALIWEKSDFYMSMFDEESAVVELAHMVKEFQISFLDEWFRRYGTEFVSHFPEYYMPYGITVSEDEIGCVNCEMYEKYFRPELHELAERYGAIGIHCCADSEHQWKNFKEVPNLKLLNLIRNEESSKNAIEYFRNDVALYPVGKVDITHLPNHQDIHLVHHASVKTRAEAIELAARFNIKNNF